VPNSPLSPRRSAIRTPVSVSAAETPTVASRCTGSGIATSPCRTPATPYPVTLHNEPYRRCVQQTGNRTGPLRSPGGTARTAEGDDVRVADRVAPFTGCTAGGCRCSLARFAVLTSAPSRGSRSTGASHREASFRRAGPSLDRDAWRRLGASARKRVTGGMRGDRGAESFHCITGDRRGCRSFVALRGAERASGAR